MSFNVEYVEFGQIWLRLACSAEVWVLYTVLSSWALLSILTGVW